MLIGIPSQIKTGEVLIWANAGSAGYPDADYTAKRLSAV